MCEKTEFKRNATQKCKSESVSKTKIIISNNRKQKQQKIIGNNQFVNKSHCLAPRTMHHTRLHSIFGWCACKFSVYVCRDTMMVQFCLYMSAIALTPRENATRAYFYFTRIADSKQKMQRIRRTTHSHIDALTGRTCNMHTACVCCSVAQRTHFDCGRICCEDKSKN